MRVTLEDIQKEVNDKKHKRDPFLQKYREFVSRDIDISDNQDNSHVGLDDLTLNLHLRANIIHAQLDNLWKETEKISTQFLEKEKQETDKKRSKKHTPLCENESSITIEEVINEKKDMLSRFSESDSSHMNKLNAPMKWLKSIQSMKKSTEPTGLSENQDRVDMTQLCISELSAELNRRVYKYSSLHGEASWSFTPYLRHIRPFAFCEEDEPEESSYSPGYDIERDTYRDIGMDIVREEWTMSAAPTDNEECIVLDPTIDDESELRISTSNSINDASKAEPCQLQLTSSMESGRHPPQSNTNTITSIDENEEKTDTSSKGVVNEEDKNAERKADELPLHFPGLHDLNLALQEHDRKLKGCRSGLRRPSCKQVSNAEDLLIPLPDPSRLEECDYLTHRFIPRRTFGVYNWDILCISKRDSMTQHDIEGDLQLPKLDSYTVAPGGQPGCTIEFPNVLSDSLNFLLGLETPFDLWSNEQGDDEGRMSRVFAGFQDDNVVVNSVTGDFTLQVEAGEEFGSADKEECYKEDSYSSNENNVVDDVWCAENFDDMEDSMKADIEGCHSDDGYDLKVSNDSSHKQKTNSIVSGVVSAGGTLLAAPDTSLSSIAPLQVWQGELLTLPEMQKYLKRNMSPPPSTSYIRLEMVLPECVVTRGYPGLPMNAGLRKYCRRLIIALCVLGDTYNRIQEELLTQDNEVKDVYQMKLLYTDPPVTTDDESKCFPEVVVTYTKLFCS